MQGPRTERDSPTKEPGGLVSPRGDKWTLKESEIFVLMCFFFFGGEVLLFKEKSFQLSMLELPNHLKLRYFSWGRLYTNVHPFNTL